VVNIRFKLRRKGMKNLILILVFKQKPGFIPQGYLIQSAIKKNRVCFRKEKAEGNRGADSKSRGYKCR